MIRALAISAAILLSSAALAGSSIPDELLGGWETDPAHCDIAAPGDGLALEFYQHEGRDYMSWINWSTEGGGCDIASVEVDGSTYSFSANCAAEEGERTPEPFSIDLSENGQSLTYWGDTYFRCAAPPADLSMTSEPLNLQWPAAVIASPALADECVYVSSHDLGTIQFLDDGAARLSLIGEPEELCRVNAGDDGANLLVCTDDNLSGRFNFANGTLGSGDGNELLALWDHVWYRQCQSADLSITSEPLDLGWPSNDGSTVPAPKASTVDLFNQAMVALSDEYAWCAAHFYTTAFSLDGAGVPDDAEQYYRLSDSALEYAYAYGEAVGRSRDAVMAQATSANADLGKVDFATLLGGDDAARCWAIMQDVTGKAYMSFSTKAPDFNFFD